MTGSQPKVDLVILFKASEDRPVSKQAAQENANKAEKEYSNLLATLRKAGLRSTGRRGLKSGQVVLLVSAPWNLLLQLVHRERESNFVLGLPASDIPTVADKERDLSEHPLSPADRLRLVHTLVVSTAHDGGLEIVPNSKQWPRVESICALHDHEFNDMWIRAWTTRALGLAIPDRELARIRDHFGDSVALYFSFLSAYARSLLVPAALGVGFWGVGLPYHPFYSILLLLWSVTWVELWRVRERTLAVRWGSLGAKRAETRRPEHSGIKKTWVARDVRVLTSVPVIIVFGIAIALLVSALFVFEAFVTRLYTGPGAEHIGLVPTVLFVLLVPRLLAVYQVAAVRLTSWEDHEHASSHEASLTRKTFALSAVVAYLGLGLSAFVYIPYGNTIMIKVQALMSLLPSNGDEKTPLFGAATEGASSPSLNPHRLQDQMFAYTVTNQGINLVLETILPFLMHYVPVLKGKAASAASYASGSNRRKRVVFEDEMGTGDKEEREILEQVRHEIGLPEYTLFGDYSEMATQFGYVVLWSAIWPLAPAMALANNWLESRSDAFKIAHNTRRPIPQRTDTVGPWLDALGFLTWLGALTNSALVYMFAPAPIPSSETGTELHPSTSIFGTSRGQILGTAALIALASSHAYFGVRAAVRHIIERVAWDSSPERAQAIQQEREVKIRYLRSLGSDAVQSSLKADGDEASGFWSHDTGLDEIKRGIKEA